MRWGIVNKLKVFSFIALSAIAIQASGAITSVTETNLGGDTPAIIELGAFGEDALTFSDRDHQHNGAAFDSASGQLSTSGGTIIGLPSYLVGNDYVRFANNARDNAGYVGTVTTDILSDFYVLIDNRINGPAGTAGSDNFTDPVLGGTLQWVIDGGWQRVNTGISPNGQADYTGVDEGGNETGPGLGLNQFYSIWKTPELATAASVGSNGTGGSNMVALVAVPIPEPSSAVLLAIGLISILRRRRR
jgi:hypothetical protein